MGWFSRPTVPTFIISKGKIKSFQSYADETDSRLDDIFKEFQTQNRQTLKITILTAVVCVILLGAAGTLISELVSDEHKIGRIAALNAVNLFSFIVTLSVAVYAYKKGVSHEPPASP
jgi:hypothetical protein